MNHFKTKFYLILIIVLALMLRIWRAGDFPVSLYTDEANQGYNAYSIMLTGRDEHGVFLPVSLRSFGDWKPPLPSYLMIPFIYLLGLKEETVRLPSVILGVGTIILTFFLVKELLKQNIYSVKIALLASLFLTISPWHILQSRSAMLVVVGLFFLEAGIYFFIKGLKRPKLIFLSFMSFYLSIYSYYGLRLVAPLIVLTLLILNRDRLRVVKKEVLCSFILGGLIILPLMVAFVKNTDVIFGRVKTLSVFYDQGVELRQWELMTQDGITADPSITRFFHNNWYMYGKNIIQRLLSHFDGRYLFLAGDKTPPFQIPNMGILYLADAIFILLGLFFLFKNKHKNRRLLIFWFLISVIPAAFTFLTPSSNRTFNAVVPVVILTSFGVVYNFHTTVRGSYAVIVGTISVFYALSFGYFLRQYFINLPINHSDWWNYGWREVVNYIKPIEKNYDRVIVSDIFGMPYIYFLFYGKYPPSEFQQKAIRPYVADRFGFEHVDGFDKYFFASEFDWEFTEKYNLQKKTIYVVPAQQAINDQDYRHIIYYPNGKPGFKIFVYE